MSLLDVAERLVNEWGRSITITKGPTSTPANVLAPWDGNTSGGASQTVLGVFLDPKNAESNFDFALKLLPKTAEFRVDWHIIIAAKGLTLTPGQGDRIADGTDTYQVVTVSPAKPGSTVYLYILQVQK